MLNFFKRATKEIVQWACSHSKGLVLAGTIGTIGLGGFGCQASVGVHDAYARGYSRPAPPVVVYEQPAVVAPYGYYPNGYYLPQGRRPHRGQGYGR